MKHTRVCIHSQLNTLNQARLYARQLALVAATALAAAVDGFHAAQLRQLLRELRPLLDPRVVAALLERRQAPVAQDRVRDAALVARRDLLLLLVSPPRRRCRRRPRGFLLLLLGGRDRAVVFEVGVGGAGARACRGLCAAGVGRPAGSRLHGGGDAMRAGTPTDSDDVTASGE
jgi:hypothetical protein